MRPNEVLIVMETILTTGGAGFIGTNFVEYFAQKYPAYRLIDLDAMIKKLFLDKLNCRMSFQSTAMFAMNQLSEI